LQFRSDYALHRGIILMQKRTIIEDPGTVDDAVEATERSARLCDELTNCRQVRDVGCYRQNLSATALKIAQLADLACDLIVCIVS
jgi:hypothetical protein